MPSIDETGRPLPLSPSRIGPKWANDWPTGFLPAGMRRYRFSRWFAPSDRVVLPLIVGEWIRMRLRDQLPSFIKQVLRPFYRAARKVYQDRKERHRRRNEIHRYWQQPSDGTNLPEEYLEGDAKSEFLVQLIRDHANPDAKTLEIGCNVGRNLNKLYQAGFKDLHAIEINSRALALLREHFPDLRAAALHNGAIEDIIPSLDDDCFDLVFTMAVFEHIHTESEWIFTEVVRVTRDILVTVEDENHLSWRHFPRNYQGIFEPLGMDQITEQSCEGVEMLSGNFVARVFRKRLTA